MSTPPIPSIPAAGADPAAAPAPDARQAALQPVLNTARLVAACLPIDSAPDAFARELQRQRAP